MICKLENIFWVTKLPGVAEVLGVLEGKCFESEKNLAAKRPLFSLEKRVRLTFPFNS
jgi:hypothetical protein